MDKLPTKITPDRLSNAVVQLGYKPDVDYQFALGLFHYALKERFQLNQERTNPPIRGFEGNPGIKYTSAPVYLDKNIKVTVNDDSLVFNILDTGYPGWKKYKESLIEALKLLENSGVALTYTSIGVRYISEYEDTDLTDCTKLKFQFGFPERKSRNFQFRSEMEEGNSIIVLALGNKIGWRPSSANDDGSRVIVSQIDIDVVKQDLNFTDIEDLMEEVENSHRLQKETFFQILTEEFLSSLNPEY